MSTRNFDLFDPDASESAENGFTRLVNNVEPLRRPEGFSGAISLPLLPDLIQIYTVSMADGALTIRRGAEHGTIWFERGDMVHAICGKETGEAAVYRLLEWQNGHFSLDPKGRASVRTITASWQNVLMEGCRRLDEAQSPARNEGLTPQKQSEGLSPSAIDAALAELESSLEDVRALAVFDSDGRAVAQRGQSLAAAGPELTEMLRRHARMMHALSLPPAFLDCFWTFGDQVHLIQPLRGGRILHLAVDGTAANFARIRRAVERVADHLSAVPSIP
ncbi:MAG TPA: DUF4388 domain-containing protein [Thermoanaerobaculia bacterium]